MSQTKKTQKKAPAKPAAAKKPAGSSKPKVKAGEVKASTSRHSKKAVSRIKKVRALQQGFAEVMTTKVDKVQDNPMIKLELPAAAKSHSKTKGSRHKGFLNELFFQVGALVSDGTALLKSGKK
ncbi:MAG: hypothetical protein HQL18_02930 [Candidatus Omnitrophica bacterium]|nr:hypothetical protein [Candidatus Omnitrophota bacterium]